LAKVKSATKSSADLTFFTCPSMLRKAVIKLKAELHGKQIRLKIKYKLITLLSTMGDYIVSNIT